jgi:hypothetical protein
MHLENSQRRHGDLSKAIIGHLPWDGGTPPVSVLHSSILAFIKVGIDTNIINHDPLKITKSKKREDGVFFSVFLHSQPRRSSPAPQPTNPPLKTGKLKVQNPWVKKPRCLHTASLSDLISPLS